jgi:hypothetical protein
MSMMSILSWRLVGEVVSSLDSGGMLCVSIEEALGKLKSKCNSEPAPLVGMVLPCCGEVISGNCLGVKLNHGLHTQCENASLKEGEYCDTCQKNAECSATGKPPYGDIRERVKYGVDYRDPLGTLTIPYANVAEKLGLSLSAAKEAALEMVWEIPEEQLVKRVTKRGRPVKSASVSDTDSDTSEVPKKKRGRKPKAVKKACTEEDQIAVLVAEAYAESGDKIQALCNEAKKEASEEGAAKEAEKVAKKAAKEAEKVAKKEAIAAKKEADKVAKKEAIAAKKAEKEADKLAKKEADKVAKKEAIEAKKAEKEADKLAKKEAIEADKLAKKEAIEADKLAKKEAIEAKKAEKEADKLAKKEAIEAKKAEKEADKLAKKEAAEAKKAEKEADKLAKKEAIEAKKAEKEADKLAKKEAAEAKKAEKLVKKEAAEAKKAEKVAKKAAKAAKKDKEVEVELETEEVDDEFEKMEVDGVKYIKQVDEDSGHIGLYHIETGEPVGIYNPETKSIEECEVESDDEV